MAVDGLLASLAASPYTSGDGRVEIDAGVVRLAVGSSQGSGYADAQLDDYHTGSRSFRWKPPLRLTLRARFSQPSEMLRGTAGFGFWNDPVGMTGRFRLRPPQAVWFFLAAAPARMPLVLDAPGQGWMASTIGLRGASFLRLAALSPLLVAGMRHTRLSVRVWQWMRQQMRLSGQPLALSGERLADWHEYSLIWARDRATFLIDDVLVARLPFAPSGPLGLVIWIDNQYLVATPQGELRSGVTECPEQWLEISELRIEGS
jgi:hypothetical protein